MNKKIYLIIAVIIIAIGCDNTKKTYMVNGVIKNIMYDQKKIVVDHDSIPGFMMPMIMSFNVKLIKEIDNISIGDSVRFELIITENSSYATSFDILGHIENKFEEDDFWDDEEFSEKKIGEKISDVTLIRMDQTKISLSESNGKYRFISFIFTRCPIPNMCPALVIKNGALASHYSKSDDVELIMISFDYLHDTPEVLSDFYSLDVNRYANWSVYSSKNRVNDLFKIASELGCEFWGIEDNKIGHNLRSALIGPDLELLKIWEGEKWLVNDVRKEINSILKLQN